MFLLCCHLTPSLGYTPRGVCHGFCGGEKWNPPRPWVQVRIGGQHACLTRQDHCYSNRAANGGRLRTP